MCLKRLPKRPKAQFSWLLREPYIPHFPALDVVFALIIILCICADLVHSLLQREKVTHLYNNLFQPRLDRERNDIVYVHHHLSLEALHSSTHNHQHFTQHNVLHKTTTIHRVHHRILVSAWESLISDLSETRREDDEMASDNDDSDGGGGFFNGADGDTSLSLSGSVNDEERMEQTSDLPEFLKNIHQDNDAAASSNDGEEQTRKLLGGQDCPDNKSTLLSIDTLSSSQTTSTTLESPSQLKDWIAYRSAQHPPHVNYMGRKMDETYTFKAAQIALPLSKHLGRQFEQEKDAKNSHEDLPSTYHL